ncbi:MAG: hypothetical protein ACFFDY_00605 [Candidatus Thorarchaeota archaeon]
MNSPKFNRAIAEYQCSGCICGNRPGNCARFKEDFGCSSQVAGTTASYIGRIFLGIPPLFARLGLYKEMRIWIFETWKDFVYKMECVGEKDYGILNVPVWKYKNKKGRILVKGLMPRINHPFLHIFLDESCYDKINCVIITEEDLKELR